MAGGNAELRPEDAVAPVDLARRPPGEDIDLERWTCPSSNISGEQHERKCHATMNAPFIQTVLGPILPEQLGPTLTHEHIVADWRAPLGEVPQVQSLWPLGRILACLRAAEDIGVTGFVDVSPDHMAPHPLLYALVAERSTLHLICATGFYALDVFPLPGRVYVPSDAVAISDQLIAAATMGVKESGVKPGIIKVSTSGRSIFETEEKILRGAAIAQQATGLAITTHTQLTRFAEEQVDILEDAGADLDRVVIGHIGWGSGVDDFPLHERLAKRGVTLGLDLVGQPCRSDDEYARMSLDLINAGYASQILFSHDQLAYARGHTELERFGYGPGWYTGDYTVVHRRLLPLLRQANVDEAVLDQILIENPRRILTVDPERYPGAVETLLWAPASDDLLTGGDGVIVSQTSVPDLRQTSAKD